MEISGERQPPVSGKRENNKAARRAAIVQLALRSFLTNGYEATTMSGIAAAMGGSKGTLWSYFKSKEEILAAVVDAAVVAFQSFLSTALDPKQDVRKVLTRFCETFIHRISMPDAIALQRLILSQVDRHPKIGWLFYDRAPAINHAAVAQYLATQMDAGVIRKDDPDDAARMLLDLCTGGYHDLVLWGINKVDAEVERREAARIVQQFLRCYVWKESLPGHMARSKHSKKRV